MKKIFTLLFVFLSMVSNAQEFDAENFLKNQWQSFIHENPQLEKLSLQEVVELANKTGEVAASNLHVVSIREISLPEVESLLKLLEASEAKIFMRHGEQQKSKKVQELSPELQKIEMMRLPDNLEDPITKASTAEWLSSMVIWKYIQERKKASFVIETSINRRAQIPACALAQALDTDCDIIQALNCLNYPPEKKVSTEEILKLLPDGTLPWNRQKVDAIAGKGTYNRILADMKEIARTPYLNTVYMAVTHTQQINAIQELKKLQSSRLGNYGFIVLTKNPPQIFPEGLFKKK